jgi:hypothetical protein
MPRKCPRTLDKAIHLFGLEIEDVGILGGLTGVGSLIFGPFLPGIIFILGWVFLLQFKKDKPAGYLIHWLYSKGVDFPGLVVSLKKIERFGIYGRNQHCKKIKISRSMEPDGGFKR